MSDNIDNIRRADEGNDPLVRGELLLSRLVDGEASERDWDEFRTMAGRGAGGLWRALAEAQRDQAVLSTAVGESLRSAERVGLPGERRRERTGSVIARIGPWAGWAAAACVAVVWGVGLVMSRSTVGPQGADNPVARPNGAMRLVSAEDAFGEYVRRGKQEGWVLAEVPERVVISTTPLENGGYRMTFLRQVIEQRTVSDIYRVGQTEAGGPVLVPASIPAQRGGSE